MSELMARPVIPIAGEEDAKQTYERVAPYLNADADVLVVNVIEKAGGGIDKASVEQRKIVAEEAFAVFQARATQDDIHVETSIRYDTDIADAIKAAARDHDASCISFVARGGGRLVEFLSGSVRSRLTIDNDVPVVVLPRGTAE